MIKMLKKYLQSFLIHVIIFGLVFSGWPMKSNVAHAANVKIRQEINIIDRYVGSASGAYATSSEIVQINTSQYTSPTYYFEVVASTTSAVSSNIYLKNATTFATVATINFSNANTYTRYRSTSFTPTTGVNEYVVVVGNEAVQKGALAARVIILQDAASIILTETQIEIGNHETGKNNTSTSALTSPKYWYYDSSKWDGSTTFSAEVTYRDYQVSSSTTWTTPGTYTNGYTVSPGTSYVQIEAWGAGGAGGVVATTGGGGGGGGGYARSTTTPAIGSTHTLVVGATTTSDSTTRNDSTYDTTTVVADGGVGSGGINGGTGGTTNTGQVTFNGASGGLGLTTNDTSGGGGGAAGPGGAGEVGAAAGTTANGAGGRGNNTTGGAAGTAGTYGSGNGGIGGTNALGGGGGGGAAGANTAGVGGAGGGPGGGGGGSEGTGGAGARGQIKIVETHGMAGIALEEDNGSFGSWTFKKMIVTNGASTSTPDRVRVSFTPTTGRNYRLVSSTTNSAASYDIYNAKIVVDQGGGEMSVDGNTQALFHMDGAVASAAKKYNTEGTAARDLAEFGTVTSVTGVVGATGDGAYSVAGGGAGANRLTTTPAASTGAMTVEFWLKMGTPTAVGAILSDYDASGNYWDFRISSAVGEGGNVGAVLWESNTSDGTTGVYGTTRVDDNQWHYIALVYDQSGTDSMKVYIDGVAESLTVYTGTNNRTGTHTADDWGIFARVLGNTPVSVAASMDELRFSNVARSASEILAYYEAIGGAITLLEPQYLLANTKFSSGTSLQNFHTLWDPAEWSTTNVYLHEGDSASGGTSDIKLQNTSGPTDVTNSAITDVIERERSASMTMPVSSATLDVVATTNNGDLYSSSIIVQAEVVIEATAPDAPTSLDAVGNYGRVNLTWVTPASDGGSAITGYKLYRDTTAAPTTLIGTLGVVTSYWDGAITNGTLYYYRVVATNAIGDSAYSNEDSATPTNAPPTAPRGSIRFTGPFMRFLGGRIRFQ